MTNDELLKQLEAEGQTEAVAALKAAMDDEPDDTEPARNEGDSERVEAVLDDEAAETRKPKSSDAGEKALLERIWSTIQQRLGVKQDDDGTAFKVMGNQWLTVWSNNFRDREGELFTTKAIDDYVRRADIGLVKPPELWDSHVPGTKSGQAEWVARHGHFLIAVGTFDDTAKGRAAQAYYARHAKEQGISHGYRFPQSRLTDGGDYHAFNTFEISPLQRGAEANRFTSYEGIKEMALSEQKKKRLVKIFGESILDDLDEAGKALEDMGVEYKDFTDANLQDDSSKDADSDLTVALKELLPDLVEGQAEAVKAATESMKAVKALQAQVAELQAYVKAQKALTPKRASAAPETELDVDDEDDKEFLRRFEKGDVDEKLVKALGASAFDQSDFRKSLSQHGLNLR